MRSRHRTPLRENPRRQNPQGKCTPCGMQYEPTKQKPTRELRPCKGKGCTLPKTHTAKYTPALSAPVHWWEMHNVGEANASEGRCMRKTALRPKAQRDTPLSPGTLHRADPSAALSICRKENFRQMQRPPQKGRDNPSLGFRDPQKRKQP